MKAAEDCLISRRLFCMSLLEPRQLSIDAHLVLKSLKTQSRWCGERLSSYPAFIVRYIYYYEWIRFLEGTDQTLLLNQKQRQQSEIVQFLTTQSHV